jgi:hypothetical protein
MSNPLSRSARQVKQVVVVTFGEIVQSLTVAGADTFDHKTALAGNLNWSACRKLIIIGIPEPTPFQVNDHAKSIFATSHPSKDQCEYAEWELTDGAIVAVMGKAQTSRNRRTNKRLDVELLINRPLRSTPPPYDQC